MGLAIVFLTMMMALFVLEGLCILAAVVFWIMAFVRKKKGKKYKSFRNLGWICLLPVMLLLLYGFFVEKKHEIQTRNQLSYQLFNGNCEKTEEQIKEERSPDWGLDANE